MAKVKVQEVPVEVEVVIPEETKAEVIVIPEETDNSDTTPEVAPTLVPTKCECGGPSIIVKNRSGSKAVCTVCDLLK